MKQRVIVPLRVAALAPFVAVGVVAVVRAATPVANSVIYACYQQTTGQLRVVAAGQACLSTEVPLAWNQTGPAGPAGPQGDAGTFSGTFQSGSGQYGLTVSDAGITLGGPGGQVVIDETGVRISSDGGVSDPAGVQGDGGIVLSGPAGSMVLDPRGVSLASDGGVSPTGASTGGGIVLSGLGVDVSGTVILLNPNPDGGAPAAARAGDSVGAGTITGGSSSVFIGP